MSKYEHALFDVLRYRLQLALHFRRPLGTGEDWEKESAASRAGFIRSLKSDLRNAERELKKDRGPFHFLRNLPDPSGNETYRSLVIEWCEKTGADSERALELGLEGIGKFLYPEMSYENSARVQRLSGVERLAAEAILEAINLTQEVEFRSPVPCEEILAAWEIKLFMECLLLLELGIHPRSYGSSSGLLHFANGEEARRVRGNILETLGHEVESLEKQSRACRQYKRWQWAKDFFHQRIDASGAEECRPLAKMIGLDIGAVYGSPSFRKGPIGCFKILYRQTGPDR